MAMAIVSISASETASYRTGDNPARWHGHLDKLLLEGEANRILLDEDEE